jgi:hypothetical protein
VEFEATITDNCCVLVADVTVSDPVLTSGSGTVGTKTCSIVQVDDTTVSVRCSVEVTDLIVCPVVLEWEVNATDCCDNTALACTAESEVDDVTPPTITCPPDATIQCDETIRITVTADDNCDPDPDITCVFTDTANPDAFTVTPISNGVFDLTLTATTVVTIRCSAEDSCGNESATCSTTVQATCNQGCSPGFWRNNLDSWCEINVAGDADLNPPNPLSNFCVAGSATLFKDAFNINCAAVPASVQADYAADFNCNTETLLQAVNRSGGGSTKFNQALFHGSAALLSAAHPGVSSVSVAAVKTKMQQAFAGTISFAQAFEFFQDVNITFGEDVGGCPLSGSN